MKKILDKQPGNAEILHFVGIIYAQLKDPDSALHYLHRALQINTANADTYLALGTTYYQKRMIDEAIDSYAKAIHLNPALAESHNSMGTALKEKGQRAEAINAYKMAIHINPEFSEAHNNLGLILQDEGNIDEAIHCFQKAIQVNPADSSAYNNLGNSFQIKGIPDEAEIFYRRAIQIQPDNPEPHQNLLFVMNYNACYDAQTIFSEHIRFANLFTEPLCFPLSHHQNERNPERRLRLGYVSPDFRKHSVASFIESILAAHHREEYEVFCYANVLTEDEVTLRLQKYTDYWRNILGKSDEQTAEYIHKDKIDILVDLAGHTTNNRILLFARKPAPVQVSWIGYPATTGLSTIDYKIIDSYTDPPGITEQFYTEKLIRMPESFLCYLPERDSPEVRPLPILSSGHITFGSFNNLDRTSPMVITLWSEMLKSIENSKLLLKTFGLSLMKNRVRLCNSKVIMSY